MAADLDCGFRSDVLFDLSPLSSEQFEPFQEFVVLCVRPSLSLLGNCVRFPDLSCGMPGMGRGQQVAQSRRCRRSCSSSSIASSHLGVRVGRCGLFALRGGPRMSGDRQQGRRSHSRQRRQSNGHVRHLPRSWIHLCVLHACLWHSTCRRWSAGWRLVTIHRVVDVRKVSRRTAEDPTTFPCSGRSGTARRGDARIDPARGIRPLR